MTCSSFKIRCFSKELGFRYVWDYLESQFSLLGVLTANLGIAVPWLLQWTELVCVYIHLYYFRRWSIYTENHKFTLVLPIPIQHHRVHPSFLPFRIVSSFSNTYGAWFPLSLITLAYLINPLNVTNCYHDHCPLPHTVALLIPLGFWYCPSGLWPLCGSALLCGWSPYLVWATISPPPPTKVTALLSPHNSFKDWII